MILSVLGLALIALVGVGVQVLMMLKLQQCQSQMNRQINERLKRLKTLIAADKTVCGAKHGGRARDSDGGVGGFAAELCPRNARP